MLPVNSGGHSAYQNFVVEMLQINPLYALLSGFQVGDAPGVGTFYDFFYRLWNTDDDNLSSHLRPLKASVKKPKKKGEKGNFLPDFNVTKVLLDSAHDAMPYYKYFRRKRITPFIDLNEKRGIKTKYKDDFTIGKDGIPICRAGLRMNHDGIEKNKHRIKYRCPLASRKYGCSCKDPCSDSKYGRTVHLATKDNPRLINIPPRDLSWFDR